MKTSDAPPPITPLEAWIAAKSGLGGLPLDIDSLRSHQLAKLNATLSLVQKRSAFYRKVLGDDPVSLASLADLANLPLTSPEQLRSAPFDFLCVRQDEVERIVTLPTSGTTGSPKRIFFTAEDQELTRDFFHHGMSTLVDPGDRVLILLPGSLPGSVGALLEEGLARMDVVGIPHGPVNDPRHTLEVMRKERVTAVVGIPVQVLWLAKLSATSTAGRAQGAVPADAGKTGEGLLGLKSVLLSTDRVPWAVVRAIEKAWGCSVFNHYGTTEMGLGGGVDCRALAGYHLREADLLFEVIDPDSGRPVPDGATGEVVFTTLTRTAMPLIRYRTGDVGRFIPEPCPCGSLLRRMAHVHERLQGAATIRGDTSGDGILRQKDLDEALFPIEGLADFRAQLRRDDAVDTLIIRVRGLEDGRTPSEHEMVQALLRVPVLSVGMVRGTISVSILIDEMGDNGVSSGTSKRKIEEISGAMR